MAKLFGSRRAFAGFWLATFLTLGLLSSASAAPPAKKSAKGGGGASTAETTGPSDYPSKHFLLHTDLTAAEAKELIGRLETMISLISKYWGHPPEGVIECYVVKDLKKWRGQRMHPDGLAKIEEGAGVTITESMRLGPKRISKSVVYAVADHGTPQHEAVHAYCGQTYGACGPLWYAEGMAEMGQYWRPNDAAVKIHPGVLKYLQRSQPKTMNEIVNSRREITGDSWQNYAWRWALCHLLATNPNYSARFRPMGLGFLTGDQVSFEDTYGSMSKEISFEYRFFLEHIDQGFRVDLCAWDWKKKFKALSGSSAITSTIVAGKGWQPSSVIVSADQKVDYSASGTWKTQKDGHEVSADGDKVGLGKLVGVIMNDFELSEPFELGEYGTFTAPSEGKLYLRCHDAWNEIADNQGTMSVKLKISGNGSPLAKPKPKAGKSSELKSSESETAEAKPAKAKSAAKSAEKKTAPAKPSPSEETE